MGAEVVLAGPVSFVGALDGLAGIVIFVLLGLALLVARRRVIARRGGTFDCSLRLHDGAHGKGWVLGIGRYSGESLEWYRVFSYATRPRRVLSRRSLQVVDRRAARGPEAFSLLSGAVVVRCNTGSEQVELAMSQDTLTGFLAWMESSPPGIPSA
jgi:uncharacterized protein DUF2550